MAAEHVAVEKTMAESQVENATHNEGPNHNPDIIEHVEGEIWSGINKQTMLAFFVRFTP